jgi:hypothetical protein
MKKVILSLLMLLGMGVGFSYADYSKDTVIAYGADGYTEYSQAWKDKKALVASENYEGAAEVAPWSWVSATLYVRAAWMLAGGVNAEGLRTYENAVANKDAILALCKKAQAALDLSVKNKMEGTGRNTTKNTQHNISALRNATNDIVVKK